MELTEKKKARIKKLLAESKKSKNTLGTIMFIALALFIVEIFTKVIASRIGITVGFVLIAISAVIWFFWAKAKRRVKEYEEVLSELVAD